MDLNASGDHPATIFGFPLPPFSIQNGEFGQGPSSQTSSPEKSTPNSAQKRRSTSGIPRLSRKKFPNAKSVIYGPHIAHKNTKNVSSQQNLSQFKSPWVPAPGLTTTTTTTQTNNRISDTEHGSLRKPTNLFCIGSEPHHLHFSSISASTSALNKNATVPFLDHEDLGDIGNLSDDSAASFPVHRRKTRGRNRKSSSSSSRERPKSKRRVSLIVDDEDSSPLPGENMPKKDQHREKVGKSDSSYTLKSKDSLIDVTAFLTSKRDEILHLWEHYLAEGEHPELLAIFENANRLAAEAANEVENLRESIHRLHEKETSLSEGDCELLDELRQRVLTKIKEFEQINTKVQNEVVAVATELQSSRPTTARSRSKSPLHKDKHTSVNFSPSPHAKAQYSKSSTDHLHKRVDTETDDAIAKEAEEIFMKKKSKTLHNLASLSASASATDIDARKYYHETFKQSPVKATFSKSNTTATTVPSSTVVDLSKLTRMYNEVLELPPVVSGHQLNHIRDIRNKNVRFQNESAEMDHGVAETLQTQLSTLLHHLKIKNDPIPSNRPSQNSDSTIEDNSEPYHEEPIIYKNKVLKLQRKLNDAEAEMEELKEDLERVESESNFKVRLLKSRFEDRLDNLENFPEYLQLTDMRLKEALQSNTELEKVVRNQEQEISKLQTINAELKQGMDKNQLEIKGVESSFQLKLKELERQNEGLSRELGYKNEELLKVSQKLSTTAFPNISSTFSRTSVHNQNQNEGPEMTQSLLRKNSKLEVKVEELRERLAKANKNVHILQVTKEKMQSRLNQRQEELLLEVEDSRARNRQLQSQIHYIRTTYHELFPMEVFYHKPHGSQVPRRTPTISKKTKKASGLGNVLAKSENSAPQPKSSKIQTPSTKSKPEQILQFETPMSKTEAWVTGQKTGGAGAGDKIQEFGSEEFTDDDEVDDNPAADRGQDVVQGQRGGAASTTVSELEDPSES